MQVRLQEYRVGPTYSHEQEMELISDVVPPLWGYSGAGTCE